MVYIYGTAPTSFALLSGSTFELLFWSWATFFLASGSMVPEAASDVEPTFSCRVIERVHKITSEMCPPAFITADAQMHEV